MNSSGKESPAGGFNFFHMAILICSPTARELAALAPKILPPEGEIPEMQPMAAEIKNRKAIFLVTGVGPLNTGIAMGHVLGLQRNSDLPVTEVLYAGLAAAFDLEKTPLKTAWRIQEEIWPEYGLNDGSTVTAKAFSIPLWTRENGENVYDRLKLDDLETLGIKEKSKAFEWGSCNSITVAGTTASFARKDYLWNAFGAALENMEGFAAAYACARAEIPFVEIRIVSTKTGPRSKYEKDVDGALKKLETILPVMGLV